MKPVEIILSTRTQQVLSQNGLDSLGDILTKTRQDMLRLKHFGRKSLKELSVELARNGLQLRVEHPQDLKLSEENLRLRSHMREMMNAAARFHRDCELLLGAR